MSAAFKTELLAFETFTADELHNIRVELSTQVERVLSRSARLIVDANASACTQLIPDLQRIHTALTLLLQHIEDWLDPDTSKEQILDLVTVRHNLRTPLNHVIGYSEIVIEDATELGLEQIVTELYKITADANYVLKLINSNLAPAPDAAFVADALPKSVPFTLIEEDEPLLPIDAPAGGGRLLVVDDDTDNRDVLCRRLLRLGYEVVSAENGLVALTLINTSNFDLVLLDIMMPEIDGYEVLQRLKADDHHQHIPVIMLSALHEMESVVRCIKLGAEDLLTKPFDPVLLRARISACLEKKRLHDREQSYLQRIKQEKRRADDLLHMVIPIGVALSAEKDFDRLLEKILRESMYLCRADGGTLYLRNECDELEFVIMRNVSLGVVLGGPSGEPIAYPPLAMYTADNQPNDQYVVTYTALTGNSVNIADAYTTEGFDFSGTRAFDARTGYHSRSFLSVPLKEGCERVIGVLQLINARNPHNDTVIPFDAGLQQMIESLSALAAVALSSYAREERLRRQIEELRIEIDESRRASQVAEITETDYFQMLQQKARSLRVRG